MTSVLGRMLELGRLRGTRKQHVLIHLMMLHCKADGVLIFLLSFIFILFDFCPYFWWVS